VDSGATRVFLVEATVGFSNTTGLLQKRVTSLIPLGIASMHLEI
ncbi:hypothetical protein Tco_1087400, partial [Tanacetum coccineum]